MRLNLGCGGDIRDGFTNVDRYSDDPRVWCGDASHLPWFKLDEIIAQDILEHFSHREVVGILKHWCERLAKGGRLEIRCPDIEQQCRLLLDGTWSPAVFSHMMFGGQDSEGNFHKTGFTLPYLCHLLVESGMEIISAEVKHIDITSDIRTSSNPNIRVIAVKK